MHLLKEQPLLAESVRVRGTWIGVVRLLFHPNAELAYVTGSLNCPISPED